MKHSFFYKSVIARPAGRLGRIFTLFLVLILAGASCATPPSNTPEPESQRTPTRLATLTPTAIPSTPPLEVPTATPTKWVPIWTPLPTYPPNDRRSVTMNLYENPTCKLPCWWGIIPGETEWNEAWQFLARFALNQMLREMHMFKSNSLPNYQLFQVLLDVPAPPLEEGYNYSPLNNLVFFMRKDSTLIEYIDVNVGNLKPYTIPQILAIYGQPEQVYIETNVWPGVNASVYLYYPAQGLMAVYHTTTDQDISNQDKFSICFQKYIRLILWSKGKPIDDEIVGGLFNANRLLGYETYVPIEKVSDIDTAEFYKLFVGSPEQVCLNIFTANLGR